MKKYNNKRFTNKTFADICCNTGSFRLAMEAAGAKCVFSTEENKHARNMYEANFGTIPESNLSEIDTYDIPYFDILCCGLPHESFVTDGFEDDIREIVKDSVFYDVLRIVHDKLPEVILLENVTKITLDGSLDIIVEALENEDYIVYYSSLNALDYGIPQNRNRMYIVAFRDDIAFKDFEFPSPVELTKCVADILEPKENIPSDLYVRADDMVMKTDITFKKEKPVQMAYVRKNSQGERIYSIEGAAICLVPNNGGRFSRTGGYLIEDRPRKLSSRECARLMGIPDDYIITESNYMATKLFASSVVVDVIQAIINEIEYIDNVEPTQNDIGYDIKEKFSDKNFGADELTEMIDSANTLYINFVWLPTYIWVSYDSLKAERISINKSELEQYKNGFIVYVETYEEEHIWDSVVRSFVDYINENYNRNFHYNEWYEVELDENERDVFTDDQLFTIFDSCYNLYVKNRFEKEAYFIVVDMDAYKAVKTTKYIEPLEDKYETILIEPMHDINLHNISDFCKYAIEKHFDIIFEVCMHYNFEIY